MKNVKSDKHGLNHLKKKCIKTNIYKLIAYPLKISKNLYIILQTKK